MPGSIKVGGSWKTTNKLAVKVSGTWRTATVSYIKVAGTWKQWFAALIKDTFTRTTSGSLGTTDTGIPWTANQGVWYANGSAAQSDTAASSYPLASVNLGSSDATVSASVSSGTGVAFWVSDANSWWASTSFNNTYSYSYSCSYTCYDYVCITAGTCTDANACGSTTTTSCPPGYVSYYGYTCGKGSCGGFPCQTADFIVTTTPNTCTSCACPNSTYGNVNPHTCYTTCSATGYNYYLRIIKSVGGVVSTATGEVSVGSQPAAIKVVTSGDNIVSQAYSDTDLTTTLGSALNYTPSSPTKGTSHGIIKAPSDYNQGSTVDNFSAGI